ncbi:hypothetical protein BT69DRAFT_1337280 [Atractiella rhizophila]|nr:hypothetical protein BT69DRAFT_1337280 [Atractiella rhizophila]
MSGIKLRDLSRRLLPLSDRGNYSPLPTSSQNSTQQQRRKFLYLALPALVILYWLFKPSSAPRWDESYVKNPYVCSPRPAFGSIEQLCDAWQPPGKGSGVEDLGRWDLAVDRHLNEEQCEMVFDKRNWIEADRAASYFKRRGGISSSDLDKAMERGANARGVILRNRFYVKDYRGGQGTRTLATLAAINQAVLTSLHPVPDIEFVIQTTDTGDASLGLPIWVLGRKEREEHLWLMPDYSWYSWPEPGVGSFQEVADQCLEREAGLTWKTKLTSLFWRGALLIPIRREFMELANKFEWGKDIMEINWGSPKDVLKTQAEHCDYKFLGHVEGFAASGRLKYILQCRSVTVAYKMEYLQHFHHLFDTSPTSKTQNMVEFKDLKELPNIMQDLIQYEDKAERIANTSFEFFRKNLSPSAVDCYWRRLFKRWAEVQNFQPMLNPRTPSYNSFRSVLPLYASSVLRLRGYNSLTHQVEWDPH